MTPAPPAVVPTRPAVASEPIAGAALSPEQELTLKPKDSFKECTTCPEMVVIPAGAFTMGSPADEAERRTNEGPQHKITFGKALAVGRFAVTFDEWDACVAGGGCNGYRPAGRCWLGPWATARDQRGLERCR
jgi:formylglycine-generating enzyme required for sulfatase activity